MYNIKDIIRMNQEIGEEGLLTNKSGLEFALDRIHKEKSWIRQCTLIIRAIITDHAFTHGNKRTAFVFFTTLCQLNEYSYNPELLAKTIHKISRQRIVDIGKIERLLEHGITRENN